MSRIKYKEAAGLEVKKGRPALGQTPSKADLIKLYVDEERSVRDIAAALGCSKDMVHRMLKEYRIEVRTSARRSILIKYQLSELEAAIKERGIRGYAREIGINPSTLSRFLKQKEEK